MPNSPRKAGGGSKKRSSAPSRRFVTVVPLGHTIPEPSRATRLERQERSRLAYRLLSPLDDALRTHMKRRGDMSRFLVEALDTADMNTMDLVDIRAGDKAPEVNLYIPARAHSRLKAAAKRRGVSHNTMVNSAMAHWLAERGLIGLRARAAGAGAG